MANIINDINCSSGQANLVTTGLAFANCAYYKGGYAVVGNIVIVNLCVKVTTALARWSKFISGLPNSAAPIGMIVHSYGEGSRYNIYLEAGAVTALESIPINADYPLCIEAVYIKD